VQNLQAEAAADDLLPDLGGAAESLLLPARMTRSRTIRTVARRLEVIASALAKDDLLGCPTLTCVESPR